MATKKKSEIDLLQATFEEIAEHGWNDLAARAIAERADRPLADVYRAFPSQGAMVRALVRRVDEAMLEVDPADFVGLPPRDRVFELMMRRFDALAPFRDGLKRLSREGWSDPALVLATVCRLDRSLAWLQAAAGLTAGGFRARLSRRALGFAYVRAFEVWLKDDSSDHAKTMAALDKALRGVEALAGLREERQPASAGERAPELA